MVFRTLPTAIVLVLVTTAGTVYGLWTGRWTADESLAEAGARLSQIPLTVGDWSGEPLEMSPREIASACADGYLSRKYSNRRTGKVVSVLLLCGRPGPISVHTPDVCYRGSGFDEVGDAVRFAPSGEPDTQLLVRRFRKDAAVPIQLRILYGWSTRGAWDAPDNPRLSFAGQPVLYKLYLIHAMQRDGEPLEGEPAIDLFRALRPHLRAALTKDPKRSS
jgi:hypothetical protein